MLIEQTVLEYLQSELNMSDVYLEIPDQIPELFVLFRVIERGKENQINAVTIEFMSYAQTKYEAAALDALVREAMENISTLDLSVHFGGGNDNPDTTLKLPRYRSYFSLYY